MSVTIRQLQIFSTVAMCGSFVEASKLLHVTPAALSIAVRDLESTLGIQLLDRTTRSVRLTGGGREYLSCAERVLMELRTTELCATDLRDRGSGIVRIATTPLITLTLLIPALTEIRRKRPDIRPVLTEASSAQGVALVEMGQADMAIAMRTTTNENLEATPLFTSQLHFVCDNQHRFAQRKRVQWREICLEPLIFIAEGAGLRLRAELPKQLHLQSTYEADHPSAALAMVASGFGAAICSGFVKPITRMHKLRFIPLVEPSIIRSFAIYTMKSSQHTPAIELHKKMLSNYFHRARSRCIESYKST